MWAFDDRSIKTELENLLGLCLQFTHLVNNKKNICSPLTFFQVSRVNLVNVFHPDDASKSNTNVNPRTPIMPPRTNLGRSDGPSGGNIAQFNNHRSGGPTSLSSDCYASPAPSPLSAITRLTHSWKKQLQLGPPSYIITVKWFNGIISHI